MMRRFVKKNKKLVVLASFLLILVSALVSAWKVFSPPTFEEELVFLDVYGNEIVVPETEPTTLQIPLLSNIILTAVFAPLLIGGWFLVRKVFGRSRQRPEENEEDRRRKSDLKRLQKTVELYYRLRQRYPKAGDKFREIVKNLDPSLEGSLGEYRYENPEGDTQRYRLWCKLKDKNDPEAREGLYELTSDKTAA